MKKKALALPLLLAAPFLPGCDSQAGADYRGEPLLSVNGSVVIQNQNPPSNLVPALAFITKQTLSFTDVEVSGEFPARFRLDVFEPPPPSSLYDWEDPGDENEPTYAMAFITAVSADHPASVSTQDDLHGYVECSPDGCTRVVDVCAPGEGCYYRVTKCDLNDENCVVIEESGNPALARGWLRYLAGLSSNYLVFYFPDGVKENTQVSYGLNGSRALAPGYYLVEVAKLSPAEEEEQFVCMEAAQQAALDRFNAAHGTAYENVFDVPFDQWNHGRATNLVARELGCKFGRYHTKLVQDTVEQPITVSISPDVEPVVFF